MLNVYFLNCQRKIVFDWECLLNIFKVTDVGGNCNTLY